MIRAVIVIAAALVQPANDAHRQQVQLATSDDGLAFTEVASPVMAHASAPDVLELSGAGAAGEKGWLAVYAADARGVRSLPDGVCRLVSRDAGKTWGAPEPVVVSGVSGGVPAEPAAVQLPDGRVRLYYVIATSARPGQPAAPDVPTLPGPPQPPPQPRSPTEPPPRERPPSIPPSTPVRPPVGPRPAEPWPVAIGSALSDDGRNFRAEEGARLQAPGISGPEIVYWPGSGSDAQWLMLFREGEGVRLARSRDGLRFERDGVFALEGAAGGPGAVVLLDGRVRVYYGTGDGVTTSASFDPRTQRLDAEAQTRVRGLDPSAAGLSAGGYVMVFRRTMPASAP